MLDKYENLFVFLIQPRKSENEWISNAPTTVFGHIGRKPRAAARWRALVG